MKKYLRFLTLLCAVMLVAGLLAGCGGEKTPGPTATPSGEPAQSAAPEQPPEEPADKYVYKMPIAEEMYTISAWRPYTSTYLTSPNEILANIELEKRTNIHIDYKLVPMDDSTTQYNLMVTSGDYTDIIFQGMNGGTPAYSGGLDKAISDGVLLELTDAVNKWMPNIKSYMDQNDDIRKQMHTDSGNIAAINVIQNGNEPAWVGPGIRLDLLDKVGISEVPQTYDELYVALTKFKNELAVEQPLIIMASGFSTLSHGMTAGFDVDPGFYNQDGTVKFGFIEPGFKEYITMMNKWYKEGLIDQEFYTRTAYTDFVAMDRIPAGKVGASENMMYTMPNMYKMMSGNPEFHMVAMPFPRKSADYVAHFRRFNEITGTTAIAVSTAVTDIDKLEKIARWLDYRFSEEGALLLNYGIEGETFEFVDGKPVFNDRILKDPNGIAPGDMMQQLTDSGYGAFYDWTRNRSTVSDEEWAAYDIWGDSASGDWVMPPVTLTSEEGTEYSVIYGDIETLVTETIPQFITGQKLLSEYDAFVEQIKSMNIARCIEIQQAALDRYLNR